MWSNLRSLSLLLIPTAVLLGCGEKKPETASGDSAVVNTASPEVSDTTSASAPDSASPSASEASSGAATNEASRPVTVEDIDRWEKGMAGEGQAVQEIAGKAKAQTSEEKTKLMMEVQEGSTAPAGAQAAGLDESRYDFVRSHLSNAVKYLAPLALQMGPEAAKLPPSMRAKMEKDLQNEAESYFKQMTWALPPEVIEALRPRAAELRKKDLELITARLKAAGIKPM
ncbi:MAG: hypothetical protein ACJ8BF_06665 [Gemmatimonadales bacterium]